jgi:hypothetical protein
MRRLLALTLLLASAAHAQTYKWLDDTGVVTYSNTPPPAAKKYASSIPDRVSTYQGEPSLTRVVGYSTPTPYEGMLQQEWLQRQRLMAESQNLDKVIAARPAEPVYYARPGFFRPVVLRPAPRRPHRP